MLDFHHCYVSLFSFVICVVFFSVSQSPPFSLKYQHPPLSPKPLCMTSDSIGLTLFPIPMPTLTPYNPPPTPPLPLRNERVATALWTPLKKRHSNFPSFPPLWLLLSPLCSQESPLHLATSSKSLFPLQRPTRTPNMPHGPPPTCTHHYLQHRHPS